ncbi:MAG: DNA mismatch repair protein MutS [Bacteroidales bacterium]|uniref:lysine 5,6-aminomutase reactivase ATPase KamC n=1 Tax=Porphyromonas sp. TaxID=1924944 RepID=UPI0029745625|nr:DNA mismatch repair protein MutS [Porphyromonas sp.]MDD7438132.1 DNA mismatch repair protein MutS [Bacteroidales bacterium]MDY3066348.1 DNA mismatch repair protein MutS [Porphyromonas sp.]
MKVFRDILEQVNGLRFVFEEMNFTSSIGRYAMLSSTWMTNIDEINRELDQVSRYISYINLGRGVELLSLQLSEVVNIMGSINTLRQKGVVCSDIDLFEIKKLALIDEKIRSISDQYQLELTNRPSLSGVLKVLDPKGERLPNFYIENEWHPDLRQIRREIEESRNEEECGELNNKLSIIEGEVRARLTLELRVFDTSMEKVLRALASDTMILAKAEWAKKNKACRPQPSSKGETILEEIINPEVSFQLKGKGREFQPVSISFVNEPTLITGANMGGKSVLLNSVALAQVLMQFGMYVPATRAHLTVVDEVVCSTGDGEDMKLGLSSFGAEMVRLNQIIERVKKGINLLVVIDEPARTTNPEEGFALVSGLVKIFEKYSVKALITTHYSGIPSNGKRWRIKGFIDGEGVGDLRVNQLEYYMDYGLVADIGDRVPREAFRIARLLEVDEEYLDLSNRSFRSVGNEK